VNNITTCDDGDGDVDVVRRVATNIFQTNNTRFSDLLCVGNEMNVRVRVRPVRKKRKKKTQVLVITTRWFRSSAVLIMSQENHSVIRHFCQRSTK